MSELWVITIALIAVALISYIVSSCLHKEEKTISYTLIAAGVTLMLSGVPTFEELILGIVANLLNFKLVAAEGEYWVRIIAGLALIVLGIALVFKIKKRIYVLNMYGIAAKKNIDDPKSAKDLKLAEYKIKEQVVNFTPFFEGNAMTQKMNNSICEQINEETKRFSAKASEQKESCFTGMAPIPYTVYAGTLLEEAKIYRYFEYNNKSNGGYYYELKKAKNKKGKTYPKLNLTFPEKPDTAAQEVVLAISITHNVRDEDVSQFNTDVVRLSLDKPEDNIIKFKQQLENYKSIIQNVLETELTDTYPQLRVIHIAASIPSCMSIEIGKTIGLKTNRLKSIVVHHYMSSMDNPYTFGLYVNGDKKGQLYK